MSVGMPDAGWRILGFGAHDDIAAKIQDSLRNAGLRSTNFALRDDEESDARLKSALAEDSYDAVAIGGFINGQDADAYPATEQTTAWFNRIINIIHVEAPEARIVLVRGPQDALTAIQRVLGPNSPSS